MIVFLLVLILLAIIAPEFLKVLFQALLWLVVIGFIVSVLIGVAT